MTSSISKSGGVGHRRVDEAEAEEGAVRIEGGRFAPVVNVIIVGGGRGGTNEVLGRMIRGAATRGYLKIE